MCLLRVANSGAGPTTLCSSCSLGCRLRSVSSLTGGVPPITEGVILLVALEQSPVLNPWWCPHLPPVVIGQHYYCWPGGSSDGGGLDLIWLTPVQCNPCLLRRPQTCTACVPSSLIGGGESPSRGPMAKSGPLSSASWPSIARGKKGVLHYLR